MGEGIDGNGVTGSAFVDEQAKVRFPDRFKVGGERLTVRVPSFQAGVVQLSSPVRVLEEDAQAIRSDYGT